MTQARVPSRSSRGVDSFNAVVGLCACGMYLWWRSDLSFAGRVCATLAASVWIAMQRAGWGHWLVDIGLLVGTAAWAAGERVRIDEFLLFELAVVFVSASLRSLAIQSVHGLEPTSSQKSRRRSHVTQRSLDRLIDTLCMLLPSPYRDDVRATLCDDVAAMRGLSWHPARIRVYLLLQFVLTLAPVAGRLLRGFIGWLLAGTLFARWFWRG